MSNTDITVEQHSVDGFTLSAIDGLGYLVRQRYIDYTLEEAKALFRQLLVEG
jgi:hypothetical protein